MSLIDLKGKKISIFCPSFFGYDCEIKKALEGLGAIVSLYDERVFSNIFGKALIRLNFRRGIKYAVEGFYKKNLLDNIKDVDYILLINPETITPNILLKAKKINPNVKVITYMWDSFKNKSYSKQYVNLSDSFFTFDPVDANRSKINFLPLFFICDYKKINGQSIIKYDFSFIGTAHSERFDLVKKITKNSQNNFLFFYCPSKIVFLYKKYFKNEINGLDFSDVSFHPMERQSLINVIEQSKVIIDINHSSQVGLTMRTIEMIGAKKKIITTNIEVVNYDFYRPENILVFTNSTSLDDINRFIKTPYNELCDNIYKKYSIESWIKQLIIL